MEKKSFTGFFSMQRENARFENNLKHSAGNLYYSLQTGFLWGQLSRNDLQISPDSFANWITKQATMRGIVVLNSELVQKGPVQTMKYKIAGSESYGESNIEGFISVG